MKDRLRGRSRFLLLGVRVPSGARTFQVLPPLRKICRMTRSRSFRASRFKLTCLFVE